MFNTEVFTELQFGRCQEAVTKKISKKYLRLHCMNVEFKYLSDGNDEIWEETSK